MKKLIIFTYGAIATLSILMFLSGIYSIIFVAKRLSDDYWWLLIPIILCSLAVYYLIKKPIIYNKYKLTLSLFTIGIFITLIVVLPPSIKIRLSGPLLGIHFIADMALLGAFAIAIVGVVISTILGTIGFLIDRKKV